MRSLIILLALANVAGADDCKAKLKLELELTRARAAKPHKVHTSARDAYADSLQSGRPLFCTVGMDCSQLCAKLRPDFVTAHFDRLDGVQGAKALLCLPSADGLFKVHEWASVPTDAEVKAKAAEWRGKLRPTHLPEATPTQSIDWSRGT